MTGAVVFSDSGMMGSSSHSNAFLVGSWADTFHASVMITFLSSMASLKPVFIFTCIWSSISTATSWHLPNREYIRSKLSRFDVSFGVIVRFRHITATYRPSVILSKGISGVTQALYHEGCDLSMPLIRCSSILGSPFAIFSFHSWMIFLPASKFLNARLHYRWSSEPSVVHEAHTRPSCFFPPFHSARDAKSLYTTLFCM